MKDKQGYSEELLNMTEEEVCEFIALRYYEEKYIPMLAWNLLHKIAQDNNWNMFHDLLKRKNEEKDGKS